MVYRERGGGPCIGLFTVWYILPVKYIYTKTQISQNKKKSLSAIKSTISRLKKFPNPPQKEVCPFPSYKEQNVLPHSLSNFQGRHLKMHLKIFFPSFQALRDLERKRKKEKMNRKWKWQENGNGITRRFSFTEHNSRKKTHLFLVNNMKLIYEVGRRC